jgi:CTD kinase subunit beta
MPSAISAMTPGSSHTTPFSPSSNPANTVEAAGFPNTYIQRSRPYLTAAQIESLRPSGSQDEARAISTRLTACQWIVQLSKVLQLYSA